MGRKYIFWHCISEGRFWADGRIHRRRNSCGGN
nr:MAG TPA: hypothetical protein [Caudoviricetes sp.]